MPSIGDSQRAAGGNNLQYYQKQRQNSALLGRHYPLHIRSAYPVQSQEQIYYGRYLTTEPPYGTRQVNQTGFGLFNGGGFLPPPPRPGSHVVTAEIGQSVSLRLGEVYQHGGRGEVGPDATQTGTGLSVISAPWLAPAADSMDGLTFISYVPINNGEYPANQLFFENKTATNYDINVGSAVKLDNLSTQVQQGEFSTNTDRLVGDIELRRAIQNYNLQFRAFTDDVDALGDPIVDTEDSPDWLDVLDQLLNLPIGNEKYRESIYCVLQTLAAEAWSGAGDNPLPTLQQSIGLNLNSQQINDILKKVNEWLPQAAKIKSLIFGDTQQRTTVGNTTVDIKTLDVTIDLGAEVAKLNGYISPPIILTENSLTVCGQTITTTQTLERIPSTLLDCLRQLNDKLPTNLKFKTYGTQRVTAVRLAPGIFISEGQALKLENKIGNPITIAIDNLRCALPNQLVDKLELSYSDRKLNSKAVSLAEFLALAKTALGYIDNTEQLITRLNQYLPAELRNVFNITNNKVTLNASALVSYGVHTLNAKLPAQMQLAINLNSNKISGISLGPLSLEFAGSNLNLGFNPAKLIGGLNIQSVIPFIPNENIRQLLEQVTIEPQLPYNDIKLDTEGQTINRGGYLVDLGDLGIKNDRKGSPVPLLLSTLDCLSPLGQDTSINSTIPQQNYGNVLNTTPYCYAEQSSLASQLSDIINIPAQNQNQGQNLVDLADISTYLDTMQLILKNPLTPTQPSLKNASTLSFYNTANLSPFANYLQDLGVINSQFILDKLIELDQTNSVKPLIEIISAVASTPTHQALNRLLEDFQPIVSSPCDLDYKTKVLAVPTSFEVVDRPDTLINWISIVEPTLLSLVETLVYGELYDFFVNLILRVTKGDIYIPGYVEQDRKLKQFIHDYFDLPD